MERDEVIKGLYQIRNWKCNGDAEMHEIIASAIKLLEQIDTTSDTISRQAAISHVGDVPYIKEHPNVGLLWKAWIESLPSAQPERTCVNCGRTANNGGWYADGRTRCPIEEHYALPKDGFCHLWEKRNVTDDDYPERRTDEE